MAKCDFCSKKKKVFRTHYGSGFGYIRLMCNDCKGKIEKEHGEKIEEIEEIKES